MLKTVAAFKVPYVMMHMQGTPKICNQKPHYSTLLKKSNLNLFEKIQLAKQLELMILSLIQDLDLVKL